MCFIHRPEYYLRSGEDAEGNDIRGLAEFIIAKHRSGGVGDVKLRFRKQYTRFENWDENYNLAASTESIIPSKMNSQTDDAMDMQVAPFAPPPTNPDFFTAGPDEPKVPF